MPMSLAAFAIAVGASRKWVQNAHAVLGMAPAYTAHRARLFALVHTLEAGFDIPLKRSYELAAQMVRSPDDPRAWRHESQDGCVMLSVDRERFLTLFAARLSRARELYVERRRGRPPKRPRPRGLEAAVEHGVDISLIEDSLMRTPAERLRRLDEDVTFLTSMEVNDK